MIAERLYYYAETNNIFDNKQAGFRKDDVSILATEKTKEETERKAQQTVDVVTNCAQEWKISPNATKSEASFFSTWSQEAKWMPTITIDGQPIKKEKTPQLLWVILDRLLNFGPHIDAIIQRTERKQRILNAVANTEWGWNKEKLIQIFVAHASSTAEKQTNWRAKSHTLQQYLPTEVTKRQPLNYFPSPPWMTAANLEIFATLPGTAERMISTQKRKSSIDKIKEANTEITIYTDGSASEGTRKGGSAAVITRGDPENPETIHVIQRKGSDFTCSYEEELDAMQTTANWISLNCDPEISIMVCTDSQSLCLALLSYNVETATIREALHNRLGRTIIQWNPGHSDVPGNELADQAAKEATKLEADPRPISYRSVCTMIRSRIKHPTNHQQLKKVYNHFSKQREQEVKTRADQVLLAQLRSGKHKVFRSYQHMIDESIDPTYAPTVTAEKYSTSNTGSSAAQMHQKQNMKFLMNKNLSVYAPQTGLPESEKDKFYNDLLAQTAIIPAEEFSIVCGNLNGHVGKDTAGFDNVHS
ncbi:uncharacterized protein [Clytia hemisphaerica]|uniref:uncharacterized protein n=1 Tax=Clytia hemisphaerica TaxID=252671 RepID=UPI0034D7229F